MEVGAEDRLGDSDGDRKGEEVGSAIGEDVGVVWMGEEVTGRKSMVSTVTL
jgi:hypothetical protein